MSGEIEYRAWDTLQGGKFEYWNPKTDKYGGIFWTMIKNKSFKEPQKYTCHHDVEGTKIYEGDIVEFVYCPKTLNEKIRGVVGVDDCGSYVIADGKALYHFENHKKCIVVGHIYRTEL